MTEGANCVSLGFLPRGPSWWELVVRSALRTYSTGAGRCVLPRRFARRGLGRLLRISDLLSGTWSSASPRRLARWGLGRPPRFVDLLGGDLVHCPASQICLAGTWSLAPPRGLVQQMGRKEVMGLTLGTRS
jgi:hypothetical protein